jgi:hypothetical protein
MIPLIVKFFQGGGIVDNETTPSVVWNNISKKDQRRARRNGMRFSKASPEEQKSWSDYSGKYKNWDDAKAAYANGERDRYAILSQLPSFDSSDPVTVYTRGTKNTNVVNGKSNVVYTSENYQEQNGRALGWKNTVVNGKSTNEHWYDLPDGSRYFELSAGESLPQWRYETPEEASKNKITYGLF